MDNSKRLEYIRVYPDAKKLFANLDKLAATDKAKVLKLIEITYEAAKSTESSLKETIQTSTKDDGSEAFTMLLQRIQDKMIVFLRNVEDYRTVVESAKSNESSRKQEQRIRLSVEEKVMSLWMEVHWLGVELRKGHQHFFCYYDVTLKVWDFSKHKGEEPTSASVPKRRFNFQTDALSIPVRPHWEEIEMETRFKDYEIKAYIRQREKSGEELERQDKEWLTEHYNDAYVDLSSSVCPTHSVYLAIEKARQFAERWGMSEIEAWYYKFIMPGNTTDELPNTIYFSTLPGEERELIVFYDNERFYSHTEIKQQIPNGYAFIKLIEMHHVFGELSNHNGKHSIKKASVPSPYPENLISDYKYSPYCTTDRMEERKQQKLESFIQNKETSAIEAQSMGLPISQYQTMRECYNAYERDIKMGKGGTMPVGLTFRQYCAWRYYGPGVEWRKLGTKPTTVYTP